MTCEHDDRWIYICKMNDERWVCLHCSIQWTMNDEYVCIAVYNERWTMIYKYDVHWGDDASYTCYLSDERW